jgi:hypothetical protein
MTLLAKPMRNGKFDYRSSQSCYRLGAAVDLRQRQGAGIAGPIARSFKELR